MNNNEKIYIAAMMSMASQFSNYLYSMKNISFSSNDGFQQLKKFVSTKRKRNKKNRKRK